MIWDSQGRAWGVFRTSPACLPATSPAPCFRGFPGTSCTPLKFFLNIYFKCVSLPLLQFSSVQFRSVVQLCPTLCNPMNCSTSGLPVHHQLPEFTQTHVHQVGDAIQPSHPLSSPSPSAPNPSQHQGLFQWVNSKDYKMLLVEKEKKGFSGSLVAKTMRSWHRLQGTQVWSLVRELRSHMLNGPAPRHPPHQNASGGLRNLKTVSSSFIQVRTQNFFFEVKHSQFVTEWELPRVPLLVWVCVVWPVHDPGQHRFLISSEGTSWFAVLALWRSPMRKWPWHSHSMSLGNAAF